MNNNLSPLDSFFNTNEIIKNFISELQNYIDKLQSAKLIPFLPKNTILTFEKYYTGIVAEEDKIEDYLKECVIAK